jgi:tetratricopeptide (TPR) repeat protein
MDLRLDAAHQLAASARWDELIGLLAPHVTPASGELAVLYGEALTRARREREAYQWLRQVQARLAHVPDRGLYRRAVNVLGVVSFRLGALSEANEAFGRALELANEAEDFLLLARASNNLGMIANLQGEYEEALGHYRGALPTYQRIGQRQGLAETYHNMAVTFRDLDQLQQADEYERHTIEYAAHGTAPRLAVMGYIGRGEIALRRGDANLAAATARYALRELESLGDALNESDARRLLGCALCQVDQLGESQEMFSSALELARSHSHALNEAETLRDRVGLWIRLRRIPSAVEDAQAALTIFARLNANRETTALSARLDALRMA